MDVFVYGTLTDRDRADAVVDEFSFLGPATLVGLRRVQGRYPTLAPPAEAGDAATDGRLLRTPAVDALDAYEATDRGLYVRTTVPSPTGPVAVYVGDPERLGAPADWPGDGPFARRVERYVGREDVSVVRER